VATGLRSGLPQRRRPARSPSPTLVVCTQPFPGRTCAAARSSSQAAAASARPFPGSGGEQRAALPQPNNPQWCYFKI